MLNKLVLLKAIENRKNGIMPNFSEIVLNQAVDLVLFNNFDIDKVCQMSEDEIDSALYENSEEDCDNDFYICPKCGKKVRIEYDGENFEGYTGFCECGKRYSISSYGMDDAMEYCDENNIKFDEHKYIQNSINNQ